MRFIDLDRVIDDVNNDILLRLRKKHNELLKKNEIQKQTAIDKGNNHWRDIKNRFEALTDRKCWYTESKNPGCLNDLEHFRPKGKVVDKDGNILYWYWFLAFNPINYRLSSQIPNRPNVNPILQETGGKHNHFPLLNGSNHCNCFNDINSELPVLLDPCCKEDTELLEFHPDGRPILSRRHIGDPIAEERVKKSKLLLNIDYPTFNEDREQLYNRIERLITTRGDRHYANGNMDALEDIKEDLQELMLPSAAYSKAAECYVRGFRDREWVEELLF